ncbi:MAG: hypothetical protein U1F22_01425 [Lysobacterales bacterium]
MRVNPAHRQHSISGAYELHGANRGDFGQCGRGTVDASADGALRVVIVAGEHMRRDVRRGLLRELRRPLTGGVLGRRPLHAENRAGARCGFRTWS